ncbi:MAG: isoprenylcysteine carboxylmethyltransferase family protein [Candidatus Eremiobacteraeota bacterium]|nr:isoprenylcysteine carboxylmethyltransferase family protein [Candidatus Eremiobacteraeota bacterium]
MYTLIIQGICLLLWLFFMVIWYRSDPAGEVRRRGALAVPVPLLIAAVFVVAFIFPFGWAFFPLALAGLVIFLAGFLCALWSKATLGDCWSPGNEIRVMHEVVREVPYSLVRHPVYVSLVVMLLGTCLIFGSLTMLAATAVCAAILSFMAYMEERLLMEELGQGYLDYQEGVPFIVPRISNMWRD